MALLSVTDSAVAMMVYVGLDENRPDSGDYRAGGLAERGRAGEFCGKFCRFDGSAPEKLTRDKLSGDYSTGRVGRLFHYLQNR